MPVRLLIALFLVPACSLQRAPIVPADTGRDTPSFDAPMPDTNGDDVFDLDAPDVVALDVPVDGPLDGPLDVPDLDVGVDGGLDAPMDVPADAPDAPTDVPMCPMAESECDRIDEDCDGTIDDGVCGSCVAFTVAGRAYLSCPAATGLTAWTGYCRRTAPGYELAIFESAAEQGMVRSALTPISTARHWVGVNDFDMNGAHVWYDRTTTGPTIGSPDPTRACVTFREFGAGLFEEAACAETMPVLCEQMRPPGGCTGSDSAPCNGVDEDCDGSVDEGIDCGGFGCTSATFWDEVVYVCTSDRSFGEATRDCRPAAGAELATLWSPTELAWVTSRLAAEVWIGLRQGSSPSSELSDWAWGSSGSRLGVPAARSTAPWAMDEPNDYPSVREDGEEDCARLRSSDGRFNDAVCGDDADFTCSRRWRY